MKYKILITDDQISWISSHSELIELSFPNEFVLQFAESAEEALEIADKFKPDLLITDLEMEKIEEETCAGVYLIKAIRKTLPDIKIIIISGAPDLHRIAEKNQVDAFIPKWSMTSYPLKLRMSLQEIFKINTEIC